MLPLVCFIDSFNYVCFLNVSRIHILDTDLWLYYVKVKNFQGCKILKLSSMYTLKEKVSFICATLTPTPTEFPGGCHCTLAPLFISFWSEWVCGLVFCCRLLCTGLLICWSRILFIGKEVALNVSCFPQALKNRCGEYQPSHNTSIILTLSSWQSVMVSITILGVKKRE